MTSTTIACFITPHGFGHATRASAVIAAVQRRDPAVRFELFTSAPRWLFEQSLDQPFGYHELAADIGLAQRNSLHEDIPETVRRLDAFLPFRPAHVETLARQVNALGCAMVLCDIAPLGIAVAQAAGLPSVLVENFTWDWIYEGYAECAPVLRPHIETLRAVFASADRHVQTEPVCAYTRSDLLTAPVCRSLRLAPNQVREKLDIPASAPVVLITMGGLSSTDQHAFFDQLAAWPQYRFVIPGGDTAATAGNVLRLPNHSAFYHPDIMRAADAVVGKTGYSTVAEAYHAGLPYGYVSRPRFRESGVMERYIQAHMRGIAFGEEEFRSGAWLKRLPDLLALGRMARDAPNGAEQIADFLLSLRQ